MNAACGDRLWWSSWLHLSYEIDAPWSFFILKLYFCSGKSISGCPISWGREVSCWCMRASPRWVGFHSWEWSMQLSWLPRSGEPFCGGEKKNSCHAGHREDSFPSGKEVHISVDGYPPLFWKIFWLGHKHVDTIPHGGDSVCLLKNVLILFVLSASDLLSPWYVPSVASRIRFKWGPPEQGGLLTLTLLWTWRHGGRFCWHGALVKDQYAEFCHFWILLDFVSGIVKCF